MGFNLRLLITDDKKEDWWLEESGRTIGPRPEIIAEFYSKTNQKFWMYTVEKFIQESAKTSDTPISQEILNEIIKVSLDAKEEYTNDIPAIEITQETFRADDGFQKGALLVRLSRPMRYATGTGKFHLRFSDIPDFEVDFIDSPYPSTKMVGLSYGCGTTRDFNIHLRARSGTLLEAGDYIFQYTARVKTNLDEISESSLNQQKDCQQSAQPGSENVGGSDTASSGGVTG